MTIGKRIELFILSCYETQASFSRETGISYSLLSKMIRDKHQPSVETLKKFQQAGMSIDWLLDESTSMYAKNANGERLKKANTESDDPVKLTIINRVKLWIKNNFGSIRNFAEILNLPYDELFTILNEDFIPNTTLIKALRSVGCNTDWLFTGEGPQSLNNQEIPIFKIDENNYIRKN
jgi:transcriptional regulator with XRE-family HTH domain